VPSRIIKMTQPKTVKRVGVQREDQKGKLGSGVNPSPLQKDLPHRGEGECPTRILGRKAEGREGTTILLEKSQRTSKGNRGQTPEQNLESGTTEDWPSRDESKKYRRPKEALGFGKGVGELPVEQKVTSK